MRIDLWKYINLITELISNKIDTDMYVGRYFKLFQDETGEMTEEEYEILNNLFCDADDSEDDPKLFPQFYITEQELRRRAELALKRLEEMMVEAGNNKKSSCCESK